MLVCGYKPRYLRFWVLGFRVWGFEDLGLRCCKCWLFKGVSMLKNTKKVDEKKSSWNQDNFFSKYQKVY